MNEEAHVNNLGILCTNLKYTRHRIDNVVDDFKHYVKASECFENVLYLEIPDEFEPGSYGVTLLIKDEIGNKLDDIYKGKHMFTCEEANALHLRFKTETKFHKWNWYLFISGKPPSEIVQRHFTDKNDSYTSCECPDEFRGACKDIVSILKKHALPLKK